MTARPENRIQLEYQAQPRQKLLHEACARQIFYGGAAGGGKSVALRWDAINFCLNNPGLQAYLFRRTLPELEDNHVKFIKQEIPPAIGTYMAAKGRMDFYNGSTLNFCYCERENDVYRYLGAEMHWIGLDEASRMLESQISLLKTRSRLGGWKPDPRYAHALPRFVMASNPGGPSHSFLKGTFIDQAPPETMFFDMNMRSSTNVADKGWTSLFIPAKMSDNKYIDADYESAFSGLPEALAKAYRDGDWDAVVGQALHNLSRPRHAIRSFTVPRHWTRFMSIDWGTYHPFSVGWYCVSDGATLQSKEEHPEVNLPPGAIIRYREWYGWNGKPNKGMRLDSTAVAVRILQEEAKTNDWVDYRVGDPSMWNRMDGPSVAERMCAVHPSFRLRQVKRSREQGYAEFLSRLAGSSTFMKDGQSADDPLLFITESCTQFWRTVPPLTVDEGKPEKGPDSGLEDHVYDECVYALMSRPYITTPDDRWLVEHEEDLKQIKIGDPYATV